MLAGLGGTAGLLQQGLLRALPARALLERAQGDQDAERDPQVVRAAGGQGFCFPWAGPSAQLLCVTESSTAGPPAASGAWWVPGREGARTSCDERPATVAAVPSLAAGAPATSRSRSGGRTWRTRRATARCVSARCHCSGGGGRWAGEAGCVVGTRTGGSAAASYGGSALFAVLPQSLCCTCLQMVLVCATVLQG